MSDPPVPMPWSGGSHQRRATSVVPAPLRASYLCPELRQWPVMQRHFAHIARSHTGGRQGGSSLPVTAHKPMGWVGSAASPPFRATRARCAQSRGLASGSRSPLSRSPRPRGAPTAPAAPCAPHPAPLSSPAAARDQLAALRGALHSAGVRCEGDGVTRPSRCARRGKSLVTAALACLKETGRTPPSRCFPCHIVLGQTLCSQLTCGRESRGQHTGLTTPCLLAPDRGSTLSKAVWEDTAIVPRQKGWAPGKAVLGHAPEIT